MAYDDLGTASDEFDDLSPDAELQEAALAIEENWVELAAESEADGDDMPPIDDTMAEDAEPPVEEFVEPEDAPEMTADQLAAIERDVDEAIANSERPVELTPELLARGDVITNQTAVLEWTFRGEGFTRKVNPDQIVSDTYKPAAAASMLRASKKGIVCPQLEAISARRKKFKKDIQIYRLPAGDFLRGGQVLVPLANVDAIDAMWLEFKNEDRELIRQFLVVYRKEQARAQEVQGPLYNPRHYPSLEKVAASFVSDRRWLVLNAPAAMQEIHATAFTEANARLRAQVAESGMEIVAGLRAEAASWVNWLVEQLAVGPDGKRKSINDEKFADAQRFFALAGNLNVAGDEEFAEVIKLGEAAIKGQDVAELKKGKGKSEARMSADALRTTLVSQFEAIKNKTIGWVVDATDTREVSSMDEA